MGTLILKISAAPSLSPSPVSCSVLLFQVCLVLVNIFSKCESAPCTRKNLKIMNVPVNVPPFPHLFQSYITLSLVYAFKLGR